ncbi:uncharacterized protein [Onthophagus taurus]|uniref:uncharacterized protein n=1 Tax=Onthophagus taurus TaxID=166361 RepID=UPI000C208A98|nr:uncharacterized protein LOC111427115 [Onthophagus taurus]
MKTFITILVFVTVANCSSLPAKNINRNHEVDDLGISEYLDIHKNNYHSTEENEETGRSLEHTVSHFLKSYDADFNLPFLGKLTFEGRDLDHDELNLKLKMHDNEVEERGKKHKLKKIFVPIFIIVLLKVITLIPLALGVLGLKTWNALQLSFVTFVISISLAVYQLCKKLAADAHPPIATHGPWEVHRKRSIGDEAQQMAYSAYTQ